MPGYELEPVPLPPQLACYRRLPDSSRRLVRERWFYRVALIGVLLPTTVLANSGTPLMWAGMIHLVLGNAVIGIGEGLFLAMCFGASRTKAIGLMVAANYLSAWLGGLFLRGWLVRSLDLDLTNGWFWFRLMVVLTFLMTLILEWPFVAAQMYGRSRWFKRSVLASLIVQGSSYLLLFGWYWSASFTSLYTKTQRVDPTDLPLPEQVAVYYIGQGDGDVYRRCVRGGATDKVFELDSTNLNDRLLTRLNTSDPSRWDIVARLETDDHLPARMVEIRTNLNLEAALDHRMTTGGLSEGTDFNFGPTPKLPSADSRWEFWSEFWAAGGLVAKDESSGASVHLAYETPFGQWTVRNVYQIAANLALFQLGHDQICAFNPAARQVALLWRGRGAVPVIENIVSPPDEAEQTSLTTTANASKIGPD